MGINIGDNEGCYSIGVVARVLDLHPQTVRMYEKLGFVSPERTEGQTRLYSNADLERLQYVVHLAKSEGVSKSGIAIILRLQEQIDTLTQRIEGLEGS